MRYLEFREPIGQHSQLNPKLWKQGELRPEVKNSLLSAAKLFHDYLEIDIPIEDVIITGAQANTTYTEWSDLDLHLVFDYKNSNCDLEQRELFDTKRRLFKQEHNITIRGIPVEPGIEDLDNPTRGNAYSLITDQWLRRSKQQTDYDLEKVQQITAIWQRLITQVGKTNNLDLMKSLLKLLTRMRKWGLSSKESEQSWANLTYKSLRNQGSIEQLRQLIRQQQDQNISIKE